MEWFSGGVPVAIATCRQQQSLFIVYIYDDSPGSNATEGAWGTTEVQEVLSGNKFVALKIAKDSTEYNQFSQLFPVFLYPSVFCIGLTGQSLVIMNGPQTKLQLREKLAEAFQKLQDELSPSEPPPPPVATPTATPPGLNGPVIATNSDTTGESSSQPTEESSSATASVSPESKEEKLKRYQEKIKQKRQERTEEEIQREKQQELKRRQQSRDTSHSKKLQEDRRNQSWVEERRKAKEEERQAKEAIRAKLEQDRRERMAERERLSQQRAAEASAPEVRQRGVSATPVISSVFSSVSTAGMCRIQLRLPAGGTSVVEMNRMDTLADLRERVAQELGGCSSSQVSLAQVYPRQELGVELDPQTLLQLQLAPSGVVIVRVARGVVSMPGGGGSVASSVWGVVMWLVQLVLSFLSFLKGTVGGVFSSGSAPSQYQQKRPPSSSAGGRVRKFRQEDFQDDKEDDRNTYNGNSTQQQ